MFYQLVVIEKSGLSVATYNPGQKNLGQLIFFLALYARFQLLTKCKVLTVAQVMNSPHAPPTM